MNMEENIFFETNNLYFNPTKQNKKSPQKRKKSTYETQIKGKIKKGKKTPANE